MLLLFLQAFELRASERQPLLIEGKSSLFQRILTLPDAEFHETPDASETASIPVPPFSVYYVYQRKIIGPNDTWLQLGFGRHGKIAGWVEEKKTLEWNQGLTLTFHSPMNHDRVLIFEDRDSLKKLVNSYDLKRYQRLYDAAVKEISLPDSPVIAIQPATELDIRNKFYLLPIQGFEDIYLQNERAKLLHVSSIPVESPTKPGPKTPKPENNHAYRADIAFVIDSTLSMQPYIDRTRQAVEKVYDRLAENGFLGEVRFALVAFRDNIEAAPELQYLTRIFVTLEQGKNPETFVKSVESLRASRTTSRDFIEDSYAGVKQALDELNWMPKAVRYIVLITDAGPRLANDPLSHTGLDAEQLNKLAQEKDVAIFVLHLLTPARPADHDSASLRYQQLSDYPDIGSLYYGVSAGDVTEFGVVIDTLADQISNQIRQFTYNSSTPSSNKAPEEDPRLTELREKVNKLGYALRLKYLKSQRDAPIPKVFDAWLLDRDFKHPDEAAIDVCVLLTRDQLSDLHDILRRVLQTAEQGLISPQNFLGELKSLAATVSRDPGQLGSTTATTRGRGHSLAEMGYLREYIEDLPYSGEVMDIELDEWQSWNTAKQVSFLNKLEEKISYYRALHDHTDLWVSLDGGPIDGNSVYPVPLDMLP